MPCLAVFGRGPQGGQLSNEHLQVIKQDPSVLADIYTVAGITPYVPVSMGTQNFRYGRNVAEPSFVCPEPTCCRLLPVYVSQLDHNVPHTSLAQPALSQAHLGQPRVGPRNFVHRAATNSQQHTNHVYRLGVFGPNFGFAIYYTFGTDVFTVVMQSGQTLWDLSVARLAAPTLFALINNGFTLAPNGGNYDVTNSAGALFGTFNQTNGNYVANLVPRSDLSNFQFLCGPCNATKNDGGVPIDQPTNY